MQKRNNLYVLNVKVVQACKEGFMDQVGVLGKGCMLPFTCTFTSKEETGVG